MLSIPLGPSTEMPSGIATSDSPVVGRDTSAFVQCIFRPYTRRSKTVDPAPSTLSAPEKQTLALTATDDVTEKSSICVDTTATMAESDARPVTPADDKSDDGIVVARGVTAFEETEGVKRRWFREEMRQSPVSRLQKMHDLIEIGTRRGMDGRGRTEQGDSSASSGCGINIYGDQSFIVLLYGIRHGGESPDRGIINGQRRRHVFCGYYT